MEAEERRQRQAALHGRGDDVHETEAHRAGGGIRSNMPRQLVGAGEQHGGLIEGDRGAMRDVAHAGIVGAEADEGGGRPPGGEHDRTVEQGHPIGTVREPFDRRSHRGVRSTRSPSCQVRCRSR